MTRRVRLVASGRVQGVFYRQSMKVEASRLGVSGWVRNLDDGRVEAVLEGGGTDALLEWARRGPAGSRVDALEVSELPPGGGLSGFEVRY